MRHNLYHLFSWLVWYAGTWNMRHNLYHLFLACGPEWYVAISTPCRIICTIYVWRCVWLYGDTLSNNKMIRIMTPSMRHSLYHLFFWLVWDGGTQAMRHNLCHPFRLCSAPTLHTHTHAHTHTYQQQTMIQIMTHALYLRSMRHNLYNPFWLCSVWIQYAYQQKGWYKLWRMLCVQ